MQPSPPKLEAVGLRKVYPGTLALDDVSLRLEEGKVHALVGKNGAGKSTLVRILAGATQPTAGQILVAGRPVRLRSPRDALHQGIATVHQEMSLVPELTVGENILFGRLPVRSGLGRWIIDWGKVFRDSRAVLEELGVELDVRAKVASLGLAQQQLVEIAKAMSFRPGVLMLDEPTSALAHHEIRRIVSRTCRSDPPGRGHRLHLTPPQRIIADCRRDFGASRRTARRHHRGGRGHAATAHCDDVRPDGLPPDARTSGPAAARRSSKSAIWASAASFRRPPSRCTPAKCWELPACWAPAAANC